MTKDIIVRIAAATLAFSVVLAAYGCKKGETAKNDNSNQPSIANSTAVINYTSVDAKGKNIDVTKVANVDDKGVNTVTIGSSLSDKIKDEESKKDFIKKKDELQISDDKIEQIVEKPAQWSEFVYDVYIANPNPQVMTFAKLTSKSNDNIIINSKLDCEYGIASGNGASIAITGLVNTSKYADAQALKEALSDIEVKLIYTLVDQDKNDGVDDWNNVTTKYVELDFSK